PEFAGTETRYASIPFSRYYIESLAGGWLRDLADHWKFPNPPGTEELSGTGLLERIQGGFAANKKWSDALERGESDPIELGVPQNDFGYQEVCRGSQTIPGLVSIPAVSLTILQLASEGRTHGAE